MAWKGLPVDDPFEPARPRLAVVDRPEDGPGMKRFFSELGLGWIALLVALAVGAVLLAAQVVR